VLGARRAAIAWVLFCASLDACCTARSAQIEERKRLQHELKEQLLHHTQLVGGCLLADTQEPYPLPPVDAPSVPEHQGPLAGENVMNVVLVGAECAPWSKTGAWAASNCWDVLGVLAGAACAHACSPLSPGKPMARAQLTVGFGVASGTRRTGALVAE
jgi:hypothetical protein